jgi:hypothetical protein
MYLVLEVSQKSGAVAPKIHGKRKHTLSPNGKLFKIDFSQENQGLWRSRFG